MIVTDIFKISDEQFVASVTGKFSPWATMGHFTSGGLISRLVTDIRVFSDDRLVASVTGKFSPWAAVGDFTSGVAVLRPVTGSSAI